MDQKQIFVAATGKRVAAFFFDELLRGLAYWPFWVQFFGQALATGELTFSWSWLGICYAFHFSARVLCLKFLNGTPGKLLCGLRLVSRSHASGKLAWSQCFLRTFCDDLSAVAGLATRVLAFIRFDRTHLSDWIAETRVVQLKPRGHFPHRRWVIACVLFVVTGWNGLQSSVRFVDIVTFSTIGK